MMGKLGWAKALLGEEASSEDIARMLYALDKNEFQMWWGPIKPFPTFDEWLLDQLSREAITEKSCKGEPE